MSASVSLSGNWLGQLPQQWLIFCSVYRRGCFVFAICKHARGNGLLMVTINYTFDSTMRCWGFSGMPTGVRTGAHMMGLLLS